jgi:hypothetical protein
MPDDSWWQPKHVVFLENKVKKYKERCVKTDLYFILNYLYTHADGESENHLPSKSATCFGFPIKPSYGTRINIKEKTDTLHKTLSIIKDWDLSRNLK